MKTNEARKAWYSNRIDVTTIDSKIREFVSVEGGWTNPLPRCTYCNRQILNTDRNCYGCGAPI